VTAAEYKNPTVLTVGVRQYWAFEIKHSTECAPSTAEEKGQEKNLINPDFRSIIDRQYGNRAGAFVLYRGENKDPGNGILWFNAADFSISLSRTRNIEATIEELSRATEKVFFAESVDMDNSDRRMESNRSKGGTGCRVRTGINTHT
jgi:hypothetical protein